MKTGFIFNWYCDEFEELLGFVMSIIERNMI